MFASRMVTPARSKAASMDDSAYRLPDLPYDEDALQPTISAQIMQLHHGTHHAGYVKKANTVLEQLEGRHRRCAVGHREAAEQ